MNLFRTLNLIQKHHFLTVCSDAIVTWWKHKNSSVLDLLIIQATLPSTLWWIILFQVIPGAYMCVCAVSVHGWDSKDIRRLQGIPYYKYISFANIDVTGKFSNHKYSILYLALPTPQVVKLAFKAQIFRLLAKSKVRNLNQRLKRVLLY